MTSAPAPSRWGPRWSRWVGRALARGLWATEVRGRECLPREGAAIVVANHVGFIDGPVLHGVIPRGSHFLIGSHMFRGPLGPILGAAGQIRVDGSGREALALGLEVLRRGDVVGMFPEGTRGAGRADAVMGGAAWLALRSGAPIVPTTMVGTRHTGEPVGVWPRPRRRILVEFGEPVDIAPPAELRGRARQEWAAQAVASALRAQVDATLATTELELPADDGGRTSAEEAPA
ncbi:lysophospholipid acyltransferase family protein [Demequina sp.]|uniref:lysophospholipid acyltransferase family protein n=1 Tax=Demequina sp. TaxID=2050685 RepID=UPI003A8C7976